MIAQEVVRRFPVMALTNNKFPPEKKYIFTRRELLLYTSGVFVLGCLTHRLFYPSHRAAR